MSEEVKVFNGKTVQEIRCKSCGRMLAKYHFDPIINKEVEIIQGTPTKRCHIDIKCHGCKEYNVIQI